MEAMLVKDAGYTLQDIHGTHERSVSYQERTDVVARLRKFLPFLDDPEPVLSIEETKEKGMSEHEVLRRLTYHDEIERIREEEQDEEMRKARRQYQNAGYSK